MAREADGLRAMQLAALAGGADEVEVCTAWSAVLGQARRCLRALETSRRRASGNSSEMTARHRSMLRALLDEGESRVSRCGADVRRAATRRVGMRLAVVGKGGAGKTALVATLARTLARRGRNVLAADLDVNPGLAFSLGLTAPASLSEEALERHAGAAYGWQLAPGVSPAGAVKRFATPAPDGVRYLGVGKIDDVDKEAPKRTVTAVLQILAGFAEPGWDVIADLEAGPTTPFEGYHSFADGALVVVGPEWRSALTARRLLPIVAPLPTLVVANRWRHEPDHPRLDPIQRLPFDAAVADAERLGRAPLDHYPGSPYLAAVDELAEVLMDKEVRT